MTQVTLIRFLKQKKRKNGPSADQPVPVEYHNLVKVNRETHIINNTNVNRDWEWFSQSQSLIKL